MVKPIRRRRPSHRPPPRAAQTPTQQAQQGIRTTALQKRDYLFGALGVSTLGVLAASSLIPLMSAGLDQGLAILLAGLGSNTLATWLTAWAEGAGAKVIGQQQASSEDQIAALAQSLDEQMAINTMLADDVATLLTKIDALPTALAALTEQLDAQSDLLLVHHEFLTRIHADLRQHHLQMSQLRQAVIAAIEHVMTFETRIDHLDTTQQDILTELVNLSQVMRQENAAILARLEQLFSPYVPDYQVVLRPMISHYTAIFGGRTTELNALDRWLATDTYPFAFLYAPTGRGKTALLIHWVDWLQQRGEWSVIFIPISLRYQTAEGSHIWGALATALADIHGERNQIQNHQKTSDELRRCVIDYLYRPLLTSQWVLVVLDGLDEAIEWQTDPSRFRIFSGDLPAHLRVIVAARQLAQTTRAIWCDQLGWPRQHVWDLELPSLDISAVQDILQRMDNPLNHSATNGSLVKEIARVSEGDPLTIRFLIESIRNRDLTPGQLEALSPGLEAFINDWLTEIRHHSAETDGVYALLSLCAVALGPLTDTDVQALAPEHLGRGVHCQRAANQVKRFVIGDGSAAHGYVFSHPRLRELFLKKLLTDNELADFQRRFVAYGRQWYDTPAQPLANYLRLFWMTHLAEHGEWTLMQRVLTDIAVRDEQYHQRWAVARYRVEGSYTSYLDDLVRLWDYADAQQQIVLGLRCALIMASIRSLSGNLTPELLVGLVMVGTLDGKWISAAALEHVRHVTNEQQKADMVKALLEADCPLDYDTVLSIIHTMRDDSRKCALYGALLPYVSIEQQSTVYTMALTAATAVADEGSRAQALRYLAPHLPPEAQTEVHTMALTAATAVADEGSRAQALRYLAPHLPPEAQTEVYAMALTAATEVAGVSGRAWALAALAPHLPPEAQTEVHTMALTSATAIRDKHNRARVLTALAPHLPPEAQMEVYTMALTSTTAMGDEYSRATALTRLVPHLPAALLPEVLTSASAMGDEYNRARVLTALAPHLPPEAQMEVHTMALTTATAIEEEDSRAEVLTALAPHLPPEAQMEVYTMALTTATAVQNEYTRAEALTRLVPHLPTALLPKVLTTATAVQNEHTRAWALTRLVPHLPTALLPKVLTTATAIRDEDRRAEVLTALAPHLPPEAQTEVYTMALTSVTAIRDEHHRAEVLTALAPHLPPEAQTEVHTMALTTATAVQNEYSRARVLTALAPHLPPEAQMEVYTMALTSTTAMGDEYSRATALTRLVPHLPAALLPEVLTAATAMRDEHHRAEVLTALAPHLPPEAQTEVHTMVLTSVTAIRNEHNRAEALTRLVPHLPAALLPEVLTNASAMRDEYSRATALTAVAPHLPPEAQFQVYAMALARATAIRGEDWRAKAFTRLVPHLPTALLPEVLTAATAIKNERLRARVLTALVPHLPAALLPEVLTSASAMGDEDSRSEVLTALAPHLPPEAQMEVYTMALTSVTAMAYEMWRAAALTRLVPHLPAALLPEVLTSASAMGDEYNRARVLTALAPHLPPEAQTEVCTMALTCATAIEDEDSRARVLTALAPHLPADLLPEVLTAATTMGDEMRRGWMLADLAPHLPAALLPEALTAATAIRDVEDRVRALTALTPHLAPHLDDRHWLITIRTLATYGRAGFLSSLTALTPWLVTLTTPAERSAIAQAISDVSRCWP